MCACFAWQTGGQFRQGAPTLPLSGSPSWCVTTRTSGPSGDVSTARDAVRNPPTSFTTFVERIGSVVRTRSVSTVPGFLRNATSYSPSHVSGSALLRSDAQVRIDLLETDDLRALRGLELVHEERDTIRCLARVRLLRAEHAVQEVEVDDPHRSRAALVACSTGRLAAAQGTCAAVARLRARRRTEWHRDRHDRCQHRRDDARAHGSPWVSARDPITLASRMKPALSHDLPDTMRAAVYRGQHEIAIEERTGARARAARGPALGEPLRHLRERPALRARRVGASRVDRGARVERRGSWPSATTSRAGRSATRWSAVRRRAVASASTAAPAARALHRAQCARGVRAP